MNRWGALALAIYVTAVVGFVAPSGFQSQPRWAAWFGVICGSFGVVCSWFLVWLFWDVTNKRNDSDGDTDE